MTMPAQILERAVKSYAYPAVTYDFAHQREIRFPGMRQLDDWLSSRLKAEEIETVKDGLAGVLYWGHYRTGIRDYRVKRFRERVHGDQLRRAIAVFGAESTGIKEIADLGLPEFRYMAFTSKVRTFLDPDRYCVLDKKIASMPSLAARLVFQPTFIPINAQNCRAYDWWVETCRALAARLQPNGAIRAVDVERGLFHLIDGGQLEIAERCLRS